MNITNSISFSGDGLPNSPQILAENIKNLPKIEDINPDSYSIGGIVEELELKFSSIFNKEKSIFLPTGTLANHLAIRELAGVNSKVIVPEQSHIYQDSGDTLQSLSGINLIPAGINAPCYDLNELEEIINKNNISRVPKKIGCIVVESPVRRQQGKVIPYKQIESISNFAKSNFIKSHLDGARIYMMSAATKIPIKKYTDLFDSVYCSLWKYFGAPWGAILSGPEEIIDGMQHTRRMFGGSIPNSSLNAAIILNGINNFEDKMNTAYDQGMILFKMLNDSEKYKIYFNENHSNVFQMHVDSEDNYNNIRLNLINNNIYLPDLNRETYGIINSENLVDIRINISLLNQKIDQTYKHFMNASP
tara:strand:+ start:20141 stop:21223 length:1083 start_codon:yes stop_codon:yes gene_type:complete